MQIIFKKNVLNQLDDLIREINTSKQDIDCVLVTRGEALQLFSAFEIYAKFRILSDNPLTDAEKIDVINNSIYKGIKLKVEGV